MEKTKWISRRVRAKTWEWTWLLKSHSSQLLFVVSSAFLLFSLCHLHAQIPDESLGSVCWWKLQRIGGAACLLLVRCQSHIEIPDGKKLRLPVIISAKQVQHYPRFSIKTGPCSPDIVFWIKLQSSSHQEAPDLHLSFGQEAKQSKLVSKWAIKHRERVLRPLLHELRLERRQAVMWVGRVSRSFVDVSW